MTDTFMGATGAHLDPFNPGYEGLSGRFDYRAWPWENPVNPVKGELMKWVDWYVTILAL
jgi:hypothetical protein